MPVSVGLLVELEALAVLTALGESLPTSSYEGGGSEGSIVRCGVLTKVFVGNC